jgi:hypothetical protein
VHGSRLKSFDGKFKTQITAKKKIHLLINHTHKNGKNGKNIFVVFPFVWLSIMEKANVFLETLLC